ncbi:MAG: DUF3822 family protein [Bacteroidales bacterium]
MQADSIISNTITEDIRQKGHQTIRFSPDGFSLLVSDASYRPVLLKRYNYDPPVKDTVQTAECIRMLKELDLFNFQGETVLIADTLNSTLIPQPYFDEKLGRELLEHQARLEPTDQVRHLLIRNRSLILLFAVPEGILDIESQFSGHVTLIHATESLISLSDQVQASDHQRGMVLIDVQPMTLDILVIREDKIRLLNKYALKDPSEFIYHTLNTVKQLGLDRESIPVYLSGSIHEEHELFGLLGKYIRTIRTTPYYMEELSRMEVVRHMILSEASKCA